MLIEIHMLKNYPPTNLNRDDTGAPKTSVFGGVSRGRISSQCLKRSWRTAPLFQEAVGTENLGVRTRKLPDLVTKKLLAMDVDPDYVAVIAPKITGFGNKDGKETKDGKTAQVVFYADADVDAIAQIVKEKMDACSSIKEIKALKAKDLQAAVKSAEVRPITLDIALFGRMVTSNAFRDVEASMQVAHAISTNKMAMESDYFTAMDDFLSGENLDELGAAMIGDTDFNSACYYVYASLDTDALLKNLEFTDHAEELVQKAVPALIRTMALTNPSGKQNSFAGNVLPSAMLVECKEQKIPTSMVNAFVEPVCPNQNGDLVYNSIVRLASEADMLSRNYGLEVTRRLWFCVDKYQVTPECQTECCESLPALIQAVEEEMN